MSHYLLAVDQSTSGTKALLVNEKGRVVTTSSMQHQQYYPQAGWVEHDAMEIYDNVLACAQAVIEKAGVDAKHIMALTLTNQRETAVMWDRETGIPVCRAIVWQCQRTNDMCNVLKENGMEPLVKLKTGLMLDPYFSATKWRWMIEHVDTVRSKLDEGNLLAGTIDSWLLWKLTGGAVHATDYTNASRTSLFNISSLSWDEELCQLFGVPSLMLPQVKCSDTIFGYTHGAGLLADGIAIAGLIGDSQAALYGNDCFNEGMAKATFGTGTSVLMNVGAKPVEPRDGLVQTIAWGQGGTMTYALEAIIRSSGDSIKWIRDNLGLFNSFEEMESLLQQATDNDGVYLIPAFVGLGAPYWQPNARAALIGMNRRTSKPHIIRAALESIAYQVCDAIELLQHSSHLELSELRVDGGASTNNRLMQFQADMLRKRVVRTDVAELSAMGSVYMGGMAIGLWHSISDLPRQSGEEIYEPSMSLAKQQQLYSGWKQAVSSVMVRTI